MKHSAVLATASARIFVQTLDRIADRSAAWIPGRVFVRAAAAAVFIASFGLLGGCSSAGIGDDDVITHLNTLNLVDDSASVQFVLNTTVVATTGYGGGSAFGPAPAGTYAVQMKAVRPTRLSGDTGVTDPIALGAATNEIFTEANDYTLIGVGTQASPQTFIISATGQRDPVAATKFAYRVVHAMPVGQAVDVYVTAPEAGIATPQFVANLAFKGASTPQLLTLTPQAGRVDTDPLYVNLTVELRASGTSTVLFNSGPLKFNESTRALLAIANNTAGRGSPYQLVSALADGTSSIIHGTNDPAAVRLVHLSYNSPALDLARVTAPAQTIAASVAFRGVSARASTPVGTIDFTATQTASPSTTAFTTQVAVVRGQGYSVYATGPAASVDDVVLADNQRAVPTHAQYRFLHAAGSLVGAAAADSAVDIYVAPTGTAVDFNAATLRQVAVLTYRTSSAYLALPAANYDVYVTRSGTTTVLLGPVNLSFAAGSSRTLALMDASAAGLELAPVNDLSN